MTNHLEHLPVAVVGAGPVGLAAAAHLSARGLAVKVYEAGPAVGSNLRDWGHVRVFTPWRYCLDEAATALLDRRGWQAPAADAFPTGAELVSAYLEPLAQTPELAAVLQTSARVTAISREGMDKVVSHGRETRPFVLAVASRGGVRCDLARAIIDASGTWTTPNPLGASGLPAFGEAEFADRIAYGIPDFLGRDRHVYAGRKTLVVGSGHSAANALLELAAARGNRAAHFVFVGNAKRRSRAHFQWRRRRPVAGARRTRCGCSGARRQRTCDPVDRICCRCAPRRERRDRR